MTRGATHVPALIVGAGAAGMMCAAEAGPGTLLVEHMARPGEKIRISGGGRCNFTNLHAGPDNFLSENPHFAKSALNRYTQWDFIDLVDRHGIGWHEKTLGQLFCDARSGAIIEMLVGELTRSGASLWVQACVTRIDHRDGRFEVEMSRDGTPCHVVADRLVIATGGKSIPKIGATDFAYRVARQFGHRVTDTRPALVPLTFGERFEALAGVACPARVACGGAAFDEALLFTHRGLSGPAILQASSYWREGAPLSVTLLPEAAPMAALRRQRAQAGRRDIVTALAEMMPRRLATERARAAGVHGRLADLSDGALARLDAALADWRIVPTGTEGYRKAEVTLGGVATDGLDSRTLESRHVPGLHFIGEAVDVTGWLGGYNFQWAWSSGWAAGRAIAERAEPGAGRARTDTAPTP